MDNNDIIKLSISQLFYRANYDIEQEGVFHVFQIG